MRPPLLEALLGDEAIATFFSDEANLAAMLRAEVALAEAEAEAGLITRDAAAAIRRVGAAFEPDWPALARGMAKDGVVVPALVAQLRAALHAPHQAAVHKGATSQDIVDTSLVLRLAQAVASLEIRLDQLVARLARIQASDGSRTVLAHTRMQVALPVTVADKVETWCAPLRRSAARLPEIKRQLLVVQLGGPVGTRSELGAAAEAVATGMARRLGLGAAPPWHAQRDGIAAFGSWLSLVSGGLGKLGQDVALLAQNEVGAVILEGGGTSSAMPHKNNPVAAEVLVTLARYNAGLLGTLHQSLVHENERSGAAWTLEWLVLPSMVVSTGAGLRTAQALLDVLRFT